MSQVDAGISSQIIAYLQANWLEGNFNVAGSTLVFYYHATSLSSEIEYIWGRKLSSVTMLFYLNRWTTFAWAVLHMSNFVPLVTLPRYVEIIPWTAFWAFNWIVEILLDIIWAALSAVRIYAISYGNWWLGGIVFLLSVVAAGANLYAAFIATTHAIVTLPVLGTQCFNDTNIPPTVNAATENVFSYEIAVSISSSTCGIVSDVLVLLVTWFRTIRIRREAKKANIKSPLASALLRDGTLYFFILTFINILDAIQNFAQITALASLGWIGVPIFSIIFSSFLLNLTASASLKDPTLGGTTSTPTLRFASFVDNMGEDLTSSLGVFEPEIDAIVSVPSANVDVAPDVVRPLRGLDRTSSDDSTDHPVWFEPKDRDDEEGPLNLDEHDSMSGTEDVH
ncbi:hypothetical protein CERSUDRAFT_93255 [Gelatoporia subvermispora B]|uniref:DUF6533 domain-containing protein n=1 Tax=Ceriporiopsis subvermispora (strain B) TaxID=914234 RepID=M2QQ51_CERS8|nr:hypothetical protein CERSUDRAFT_93255 [Gelatoporia subvermispora B]